MKLKISYPILIAIPLISLLAASCSSNKVNTLNRPSASQVDTNSNSNSNQTTSQLDDGQVAGATTLPTKDITVGTQKITVEVADNDATREQGLSDRDKLDEGKGMLFDFTNTDFRKPGFWMKDMHFSIDIICKCACN